MDFVMDMLSSYICVDKPVTLCWIRRHDFCICQFPSCGRHINEMR